MFAAIGVFALSVCACGPSEHSPDGDPGGSRSDEPAGDRVLFASLQSDRRMEIVTRVLRENRVPYWGSVSMGIADVHVQVEDFERARRLIDAALSEGNK